MDREHARAIIYQISALQPGTRYRVLGDVRTRKHQLLVSAAPDKLTDEQVDLLREHRDELAEYLCTPPALAGECIRGHSIEWDISPYGNWLCSCYFLPAPAKAQIRHETQPAAANDSPSKKSYWVEDTQPVRISRGVHHD